VTGPEHYREAERLSAAARADFRDAGEGKARAYAKDRVAVGLAAAQVHATLALAAATVDAATGGAAPGVMSGKPSEWMLAVSN
jgi:hypothetical protein